VASSYVVDADVVDLRAVSMSIVDVGVPSFVSQMHFVSTTQGVVDVKSLVCDEDAVGADGSFVNGSLIKTDLDISLPFSILHQLCRSIFLRFSTGCDDWVYLVFRPARGINCTSFL
jgi:hypothetical protein